MIVQQLKELIGRSIVLPVSSAYSALTISDPEVGKFVRWKSDLSGLENADITGQGAIGLPVSIADGGTNATSAAAALANLGAQADLDVPSQAEAEAGTATDERIWTAQRVGQAVAALGPAAVPRSYLAGLALSNNGVDAAHDIDIAAGVCRDAANSVGMALSAALTKRIDATWAAGNGAGGMNDGDVVGANEWFHVFLLSDADGSTVDAGFDTSLTAANLLADAAVSAAGLTKYRRLGSVLTDGSANVIGFSQEGDEFLWKDPPLDVDVTDQGASSVTRTISVPTGIKVRANVVVFTNENGESVYARPLDQNDEAPSATAAPLFTVGYSNTGGSANGAENVQVLPIRTNASAQIATRGTAANLVLKVVTLGWIDRRGRDD